MDGREPEHVQNVNMLDRTEALIKMRPRKPENVRLRSSKTFFTLSVQVCDLTFNYGAF